MKATLLEGVMPLVDDNELMRSLAVPTVDSLPKGISMAIGIERPTNEMYRVIETTSLIEAIGIWQMMLQPKGSTAFCFPRRHVHAALTSSPTEFRVDPWTDCVCTTQMARC